MDRMVMEARVRKPLSKGGLNSLRAEDRVPAVIYGRGEETLPLVVDGKGLRQILTTGGSNVLLDLAVKSQGKKTLQETVMFKDIQRDIILKDRILHVDFIRISMTDKIEVSVYLNFHGEPAGAAHGGVLSMVSREVEVRCLPGDIPEQFDVDISGLEIGDSITAESLELPADIELITLPETTLAQVQAPMAEEEPTAEEAAALGGQPEEDAETSPSAAEDEGGEEES